MTLKFSFFYKHSNKDYFLGLLQKVANAHSVEIRAEMCDETLCVFVSAENAEILGTFADTLESEIPLSLYFRLKSAELYEKPLSAEKVAQNLENIFSVSEINAIKNPSDSRFCDIFSDSTSRVAHNNRRIDSPDSFKNALTNLCDSLQKGQGITVSTSKGAILLSTKSNDFDFILANDISTISLYTRASSDELNALASFEKPLINLNIKEVFAREVGVKNALFILPYDIILCCISSILLNREIAFVYGKKIDSANLNLVYDSTHTSDFFEIVMGQNGYFLSKNFLDLSANPKAKNISNLWDFLDFSFDNFKDESKNSDIFITYLSTKNPTHLANLHNKTQILKIAFDKNPKNILQKITTLENGDKLIANFAREFAPRFQAIQSLDSTPQMSENIMDIFECAAMILGQKRDKNAIFDLAQSYLRDIGPKIDFKNVNNSSLDSLNSPLELHSVDSANFGHSQTPSLASRPKFAENYESQTENPSVVLNARNGKSMQESPKSKLQTSDLIYDESRTIRSVISFTLAGSEPEVIAFGIIESLVDYLILIFRDAQKRFGIKNIGIIGDMFANKIFFDKITQKIPKDFDLVFPKYLEIR